MSSFLVYSWNGASTKWRLQLHDDHFHYSIAWRINRLDYYPVLDFRENPNTHGSPTPQWLCEISSLASLSPKTPWQPQLPPIQGKCQKQNTKTSLAGEGEIWNCLLTSLGDNCSSKTEIARFFCPSSSESISVLFLIGLINHFAWDEHMYTRVIIHCSLCDWLGVYDFIFQHKLESTISIISLSVHLHASTERKEGRKRLTTTEMRAQKYFLSGHLLSQFVFPSRCLSLTKQHFCSPSKKPANLFYGKEWEWEMHTPRAMTPLLLILLRIFVFITPWQKMSLSAHCRVS